MAIESFSEHLYTRELRLAQFIEIDNERILHDVDVMGDEWAEREETAEFAEHQEEDGLQV